MAYDPFDQQQPQAAPEEDYVAKRRRLTAKVQEPREDLMRALQALGIGDHADDPVAQMGRGLYQKEATQLPQAYEDLLGRLPTSDALMPSNLRPGAEAADYIRKSELPEAREAAVQLAQLMQGPGEGGLQKKLAAQDLPIREAAAKRYGAESERMAKRPIVSSGQMEAERQQREDVGGMAIQSQAALEATRNALGGQADPDKNIAEMEAAAAKQEAGAQAKEEGAKASARELALKNSVDEGDLESQLIHSIQGRKSLEKTPGVLDWLAVILGGLGKGNPLDIVEQLTGRKAEANAKRQDEQQLIQLLGMRNNRKLAEQRFSRAGQPKPLSDPQIRSGFAKAMGPQVTSQMEHAQRVLDNPLSLPADKQWAQQASAIFLEAENQLKDLYEQTGNIPIMATEREAPALAKLRALSR